VLLSLAAIVYGVPLLNDGLRGRSPARNAYATEAPRNSLIFFGNSYTATGYNYAGPRPSDSNPLGNPNFPGNTFSKGDNWATYLTARFNRSLTYTYDFAWGCATVDSNLVSQCDDTIVSVTDQISYFRDKYWAGDPRAWQGDNTLTAIWVGINDAHRSYQRPDAEDLMRRVVDRYFELVTTLTLMGLKNILILGVPAYERTPQVLNKPPEEQRREKIVYDAFNGALASKFATFKSRYAGSVRMVLIDTVPMFYQISNNPASLQAPDATCIGKDQGCLWADDFHPTPKVHLVVAESVKQALQEIPWFFG